MVRTQIRLTPEQHRRVKEWAGRLGISLSEAIRRCVTDRLAIQGPTAGREGRIHQALAVVGKYADRTRRSSVARDHDEHLARTYRR
jgi:hypothetical protein